MTRRFALLPIVALASLIGCSESPPASPASGGASGSGGSSGSGGAAGTAPIGGPPEIVQVLVSGALDNNDKSVTLAVDVTDPDGLADISGGKLYSADKAQFLGPFTQLSAGTYSATISWQSLNDVSPVAFPKGSSVSRSVLIEFSDMAGGLASKEQALTLSCAGCGPECLACGVCKLDPGCNICDLSGKTKTCTELCNSVGMTCACSYPSCQNFTCAIGTCDSPCPSGASCSCRCE